MASDADRLRGKQLFLAGRTVPQVATELGVGRTTVHEWRHKYDWDLALTEQANRAERVRTEANDQAVRDTARLGVLSAARRRELLALCAEDATAKWSERIAAIKADAEIDPAERGDADGAGPSDRFVVVDPGNA